MNKNSKKGIKGEDRIRRFCTFLAGMKVNEEAKITNIAKEIGVHVNTVKDMVDAYETIKDAAEIIIIRGEDDKIKRIVRIKEENRDLAFKKEIRDTLTNINTKIYQLSEDIKEIKKIKEKKKIQT